MQHNFRYTEGMRTSKSEARITIKTRLEAIADSEYMALSARALQNVRSVLAELRVDSQTPAILLYVPLPQWREVSLSELATEYPSATFECAPSRKDALFPVGTYNVIFVPLYGFNQSGYRLGHGGGWYDRFLATQPQA